MHFLLGFVCELGEQSWALKTVVYAMLGQTRVNAHCKGTWEEHYRQLTSYRHMGRIFPHTSVDVLYTSVNNIATYVR